MGSFTIPCVIREHTFSKALCDLGASFTLMSYSLAKRLNLWEIELTALSLQMVDRSMASPEGVIEYVLIKVGKFIFPMDFVVLIMEEDEKVPLILERPFLATSRALNDVKSGELTLRVRDDKVQPSIYQNDNSKKKENEGCMKIEVTPMHGSVSMTTSNIKGIKKFNYCKAKGNTILP